MKTVEDIKKILESKLLSDRRTDYSIWDISTYETNPYPFRISLSVPSGKRFADIASEFSFWKKSMLTFVSVLGVAFRLRIARFRQQVSWLKFLLL